MQTHMLGVIGVEGCYTHPWSHVTHTLSMIRVEGCYTCTAWHMLVLHS